MDKSLFQRFVYQQHFSLGRIDMFKKDSVNNIKNHRVTFSFKATEAKEVILSGDFNNWSPKKHPMKKNWNGMQWNGTWEKTVMLPPGKYEYKFLVDGKWENDPLNEKTHMNSFNTTNNVIEIH
jgi:1,4-alpha-glucan branching enzyme